MTSETNRVLFIVTALVLGGTLITFRSSFARLIVREQNRTWGFRFGDRTVKGAELVCVVVGIAAFGFGILAFLRII
jgi:hypothetical protein